MPAFWLNPAKSMGGAKPKSIFARLQLFLLEEPTMLKHLMAAALQVILPCASTHVAETTDGMTPDA
jgi:hypothetical protein